MAILFILIDSQENLSDMDYNITRKNLKISQFIEQDCVYILVEEHEPVCGACKNHDLFC